MTLQPPHTRNHTVSRLEQSEVQRLIQNTYRSRSKYALMIKTLFQTGARVSEFVPSASRVSSWMAIHCKFTSCMPNGAQIDRDGRVRTDAAGKSAYTTIVSFETAVTRDCWQQSMLTTALRDAP